MVKMSSQLSFTCLYCMNAMIQIIKYILIQVFVLSLENKAYVINSLLVHPQI